MIKIEVMSPGDQDEFPGPTNIIIDPSCPPSVIRFMQGGIEVGRIVNIGNVALDRCKVDDWHELKCIHCGSPAVKQVQGCRDVRTACGARFLREGDGVYRWLRCAGYQKNCALWLVEQIKEVCNLQNERDILHKLRASYLADCDGL